MSGVVGLDDVVGQAASVADCPAFGLGPVPDGLESFPAPGHNATGVARRGRAGAPSAGTGTAPGASRRCDVGSKDFTQVVCVLARQVYLVLYAVECEGDGVLGFGLAIQ